MITQTATAIEAPVEINTEQSRPETTEKPVVRYQDMTARLAECRESRERMMRAALTGNAPFSLMR